MGKLSISVSDQLEKFVSERVASGEYIDAGEYVSDLLRRDQKKRDAYEKLGRMIDQAEASGVSKRTFDEIWDAGAERGRAKKEAAAKASRRG
jgi:antitoxin ParD1/3/4